MDELDFGQGSSRPAAPGLRAILARAGRWLRLRDGWLLAQRALWIGCLGGLLMQLAGRLWPDDVGFDLDVAIDAASPDCDATDGSDLGAPTGTSVPNLRSVATPDPHSFEVHFHEGEFERMGYRPEPSLMAKEWTAGLTD